MHLKTLVFTFFVGLLFLNAHESEGDNSRHTFIFNKGQWPKQVVFKAEIPTAGSIYFEKNAIHYQFIEIPYDHPSGSPTSHKHNSLVKGHVFKAVYLGSNPNVRHSQYNKSNYYYNYFIGNDSSKWKGKVPLYNRIQYGDLYEGIDLISYKKHGQLKYDYYIKPGADPRQIMVRYVGVSTPTIKNGKLVIKHHVGQMIEEKPYAYQFNASGEKVEVPCNYTIDEEGVMSFEFPKAYDNTIELIIDPVLEFSTYSGSSADNFGMTATYDNEGAAYMGGIVYGDGYRTTTGAFDQTFSSAGLIDISISKFSSDGSSLEYSTYLGGRGSETAHSLVVNDDLELYVLGATNSNNYPTTANAVNRSFTSSSFNVGTPIHTFGNGVDIVVTKFSADGSSLEGSTYYGGDDIDGLNSNGFGNFGATTFNYGDSYRGEIIIDSLGNCLIGTSTWSSNLQGAVNSKNRRQDGLIVKFSSDLDNVIWARYLGGEVRDAIYSLKVLSGNRILVGGGTNSNKAANDTLFPTTTGVYTENPPGGRTDGFISIISEDGDSIEASTFIGTDLYDQVYFVDFDRDENIYAYGQTEDEFPLLNTAVADTLAGQFIIKLDPNLDSVLMSTTFGANQTINISPTAFLVDQCLNIYVSGWGGDIDENEGSKIVNNNLPITSDSISDSTGRKTTDGNDFYLYVLQQGLDSNFNLIAKDVVYARFIGGSNSDDHVDGGTSRFDKNGVIYQSVCASCGDEVDDFPTDNGRFKIDRSRRPNDTTASGCNNGLFKLDFQISPAAEFSVTQSEFCLNEAAMDTISVTITDESVKSDDISWDFNGTIINNATFRDTTIFITTPGRYTIRQDIENVACAIGDFKTIDLNIRPDNIELLASSDTVICYEDTTEITAFSNGSANSFIWSKSRDFSDTLSGTDSSIRVALNPGKNVFYFQAGNDITNACEKFDSLEVDYFPTVVTASISADTVCENTPVFVSSTQQNVDRFLWDFGNTVIDSTSLQREVFYPVPGDYTISLEIENNNCSISDLIEFDLHVRENNLAFANLNDTLACGRNGLRVTKPSQGNATNYIWSSNRNFTDTLNGSTADSSFLISQTDSAQFFIKISDGFCERIDSINAEYIEYELVLGALVDSACTPFREILQTTIIGTDSFRISLGNGLSTTTDSTPEIYFPDPGVYTVSLTGSNQKCGIQQTLSETIQVFQGVEIETFTDTTICQGDTIEISANTFGTGTDFFWDTSSDFSNPINNPLDSSIRVSPTTSTFYFFRAENEFCDGEDSLELITDFVDVELNDETLCQGDTLVLIADIINASSSLNFVWEPNDSILSGQGTDRIQTAPWEDLQINLTATNAIGCLDIDSATIDVRVSEFDSAIIFSSTDTAYKSQLVRLSTNRNGVNLVYFWEPAEVMDNPNSPEPSLTASETDTFKVTILDMNTTCEVEAFKRLVVFEITCEEPNIFVPTAFTPNNDQANDILFVRGTHLESIEFMLFNRWGEKVFETNEKDKGWDGVYKGRAVDPGVFVYYLNAICLDGQRYSKKGNITLIR